MNAQPSFYVIAYDLRKPGQDYDRMEDKINELEDQIKILETTWIVKTTQTAHEIYDLVEPALDRNDRIFIAPINLATSWGYLNTEIATWINARINAV